MFRRTCFMSSAVLAAWLVLAARAAAVAPEIRDEGKFFSPEAVKRANEQIRDIFGKHGKDLLIETFPSVPPDQLEKVKAMNAKEKTEYFHNKAVDRCKQRVVNGVYIIITREPKYLYVEITPQARAVLDQQTRGQVRAILISNFEENRFDDGLAGVVKAVQERLGKASAK
jgi:uncharacterized membrane protein YgcG